ncbi:MAG TPA: DUF6607 family protein [Nitrospiraceae bacterium]|nr:DUF6607 family protein [Nitrospiraceae bacterium]
MNAQHRRLIGLVNARSRSVLTAALFLLCWEAVALAGPHGIGTGDKNEKFQHDRKAILAMAGNYHVSFNFRETVSFVEGYTLKAPYEPDGYEIVRVIRDDGGLISLQHILVAGGIWGGPSTHQTLAAGLAIRTGTHFRVCRSKCVAHPSTG